MNDLMSKGRKLLPEEKQALKRATESGAESTIISLKDDKSAATMLNMLEVEKNKEEMDAFKKRYDNYEKEVKEAQSQIGKDLTGLEIMPVYAYVLVQPFKVNPFQENKRTDSGLFLPQGIAGVYKSEEDGKQHEEDQFVITGVVIETGPTCEFVKPGDVVMYPKPADIIVPFYNHGFRLVHEQRLMCVINENLTERKNNVIKK